MSESTSTSADDRPADQNGSPSFEDTGAILFPELVWAHHVWQHDAGLGPRGASDDDKPSGRPAVRRADNAEKAYRAKLKAFELAEGEIQDAYWCWSEASAVALTVKRPSRFSLRRREREIHLHRATDWATMRIHEVAELMHHFDSLAIRASEILTPTPKRIAMERIFAEQSYLLGFVETTSRKPTEKERAALVHKQRTALREIEGYYDRAAQNAARIYYFFGMMLGLGFLTAAAAAVALPLALFAGVEHIEMRDYLSSYLAGAIGAIVSVMSRMRQDPRSPQAFRVDYEVGKAPLWFLGAVRPILGAIFGTTTYFALRSGLIVLTPSGEETEFYFYALLAFLAGFSERFTHVLLGQIEDAAGPQRAPQGSRGEPSATPPPVQPPPADGEPA
jgi:hypothetical protein